MNMKAFGSHGASEFSVAKCPSNTLSMTNSIIANYSDFKNESHVIVENGRNQKFLFTVKTDDGIQQGSLGFSGIQRKWAYLGIGQKIRVQACKMSDAIAQEVVFEIDFFRRQQAKTKINFNTDEMVDIYSRHFREFNHSFMEDQEFLVTMNDIHLILTVKEIKTKSAMQVNGRLTGLFSLGETNVMFSSAPESSILLGGKHRIRKQNAGIINPDFDFQRLGIG
uniref:Vesicle-fusing ATPase n=2 Tax=Ciona intestinalis TaxID=7719 RepID=F6WAC8_CIOIN